MMAHTVSSMAAAKATLGRLAELGLDAHAEELGSYLRERLAEDVYKRQAQTCNASKVVFLTDVDGLYRDFSDKESLIGRMTAADARALMEDATLSLSLIHI